MKPQLLHAVFVTVLILGIVTFPEQTRAQTADLTSVEGYIFDRNTLRPLENATVIYAEILPAGNPQGILVRVDATGSNGFYQMEFTPTSCTESCVDIRYIHVICQTALGPFTTGLPLYDVLQATAYRRDAYVSLPTGVTSCLRGS